MNQKVSPEENSRVGLWLLLWVTVMIGIVPVITYAQTSDEALSNLAERIAEKRSQVESLSAELELAKTEYNEQLRSLATQQADVEAQIKREELRLDQIEQDLEEYKARIEQTRSALEDIEPMIARVLVQLETYIRNALPFKVPERLEEVETLKRLLDEGSLETGKLLARIWNMVESEFRMTTESGLYKQSIEIDGSSQLAEVARLGMVFMYIRTLDERYGYVVPAGNGWEYKVTEDREEQQQIAELFDSLRKNLREGFFDIPNPTAKR
jgi:archaellum component FlaC